LDDTAAAALNNPIFFQRSPLICLFIFCIMSFAVLRKSRQILRPVCLLAYTLYLRVTIKDFYIFQNLILLAVENYLMYTVANFQRRMSNRLGCTMLSQSVGQRALLYYSLKFI